MRTALAAVVLVAFTPATALAVNCKVGASGIAFGTYNQTLRPTVSTGGISINCSGNRPITLSIALNAGVHAGGSFANRRMSSGTSFLAYQLYTNPARTTVWGDGTGGTIPVIDTVPCFPSCIHATRAYTIYGRIPALQLPRPGTYGDTITVTVTFN